MGPATGTKRQLVFTNFDEVRAELDRLHTGGYQRTGNWELAQICDHLCYFIDASVDGAKFRVPWILKALFGRMVLRRILDSGKMKEGTFTPQKPLPEPGGNEGDAVERLKKSISRFESHQGELHASPFFGYLTSEEWRRLHLIHCGHHLGCLLPK
jgi:hypothetical protein